MDAGAHDPSEEAELEPRPPVREDLIQLCRRLNELGARYLVVGGFAVIYSGYARTTGDIAILMDTAPENKAKVYTALEIFPDKAVRELKPGEVSQYVVVRVADEVIVALMASASGIDYAAALPEVETRAVDGVEIPFASPLLLYRMKHKTHREKDAGDVVFLRRLLESRGIPLPV